MLNSNFAKIVICFIALFFVLSIKSYSQINSPYFEVSDLSVYKDNNGSAILTYIVTYRNQYVSFFWRDRTITNKRSFFAVRSSTSYSGGESISSGVGEYCLKGPTGMDFFGTTYSRVCVRYICDTPRVTLNNESIGSRILWRADDIEPRNCQTSPGNRMFFAYNIKSGINNVIFSTDGGLTFNSDTASRKMEILQFHPVYDSVLFGRNSKGDLIVSNDTGKTCRVLDTLLDWKTGAQILFDKNLNLFYTIAEAKAPSSFLSLYKSQNLHDWVYVRDVNQSLKIIAGYKPNELYMLDNGVVKFSNDCGTTFNLATEFPATVNDIGTAYGVDSLFFLKDSVLYAHSANGITQLFITSAIEQQDESVKSDKTELMQNYPNPAGTYTTISYTLPEPSKVTLKIYNLLGEEVKTVRKGTQLPQGVQKEDIDLSNLPNGVYIYNLEVNGKRESKKMMVVK